MSGNRLDRTLNAANTAYTVAGKIGTFLMALFFFLTGAVLLGYGIYWFNERAESMDEYILAQGTVTGMKEQEDAERSGYVYAPIVTYKAGDGIEYKYHSGHFSYPPSYIKGEKVDIYYKRSDPNDAFINTFLEKWFTGLLTVTVGVILIPIGIWLMFSVFRRSRESVSNYKAGTGQSTMSVN